MGVTPAKRTSGPPHCTHDRFERARLWRDHGSLSAPVGFRVFVELPDQQIGIRFQPLTQHDLNEVRPAYLHLSSDGVQGVRGRRVQRHASDVSEHQRGAPENDLKIGARHVRDAVGGADVELAGLNRGVRTGLMLERQREGIAKAKAEGKYEGRQPTAPPRQRT